MLVATGWSWGRIGCVHERRCERVRTTFRGIGSCSFRRERAWHLAPEAEIDHAPGGQPEDLGQSAGKLPDPAQ